MARMIINIKDDTSEKDAILCVNEVVNLGRISDDGKSYCFCTRFKDNTVVISNKNKKGTDVFWVYREKAGGRMTIDEIKKSLELLKAEIEWDKSLEYQIVIDDAVKMLEELKELRKCVKSSAFQDGYNKAIDDFVKLLKDDVLHAIFNSRNSLAEHIDDIAEQLKGEKNE